MAQKRSTRRLPFRRRIRLGKESPTYLGYVVDISEEGIQIEARNLYVPGTRIVISFQEDNVQAKDGGETKVEGLVKWSTRIAGSLSGKMGVVVISDTDGIIKTIYKERIAKLTK